MTSENNHHSTDTVDTADAVNKVVMALNKVLYSLVAMFVSSFLYGWVLSVLWSWFVVDQFHIAPLSIRDAYGISILFSMLLSGISTRLPEPQGTNKEHPVLSAIVLGFTIPLVFLALGFLVHLF